MRLLPVHLCRGLGILLGVIAAAMAQGQPGKTDKPASPAATGSVHRIVIFEGPNQSVHYVTSGNLSTGDRLAVMDLERSENELTYLSNVQSLKHQYVNSERVLEPQRRYVQEQLYGTQIRYGGSNSIYGRSGYGGRGYSPYFYGGFYGGYPGSFGGYSESSSYSAIRSLQFGMGDEGRLKNALVSVIAKDATPEYATTARRSYEDSVTLASSSPTLSRILSLPKSEGRRPEAQGPYKKGTRLTVTLKDKEKLTGTVEADGPEWLTLRTADSRVTIRKAEILRYAEPLGAPAPK
jgi:hypothetical protein